MELHKCLPEDLEPLASISRKTYQQHYKYLWEDQGKAYMQQQFNLEVLTRQIMDDDCDLFLIKLGDQVIGVLKLIYHSPVLNHPSESCLEIQRIYLLKEHIGKGLGTKIFNQIERIARKKSLFILWLNAMDSSSARSFYEKCGYHIVGKTNLMLSGIKPNLGEMYIMVKLII